jgi:hypothetical protein
MRLPGAWKKSEQPLESLDKHSACHAEGRGFEPRRSRHFQRFGYPSAFDFQAAPRGIAIGN